MTPRLTAFACTLGLVATLVVAAVHEHRPAALEHGADAQGCVYCSGGLATTSAPVVPQFIQQSWPSVEHRAPLSPVLTRRQPIAHSGNAPPV